MSESPGERSLQRLRSDKAQASGLAALIIGDLCETPMVRLIPPEWMAGRVRTAVARELESDVVRAWLKEQILRVLSDWEGDDRTLRTWVPKEANRPLRAALSQPWTPDPELTLRLLDQGAIRHLLKAVLEHTLMGFATRVRDLEKGVLGGVGGKAIKRGKGLFGGAKSGLGGVAGRLSGVTNVAESLVGAVRDEVEASLERRVKGFVTEALSDAVRVLADTIASDTFAKPFSDLRLGAVDVALDTPLDRWAVEGQKIDLEKMLDVVKEALRTSILDDTFSQRVGTATRDLLREQSLGVWLDRWDVRKVWTDSARHLLTLRLDSITASRDFEDWWMALHAT